eukprot:1147514-Pelagomonas_calceolata.AAC.3
MASSWKLGAGMISWTVARLDAHIRIIKLAQHKQCKCSSSAKFQSSSLTPLRKINGSSKCSQHEDDPDHSFTNKQGDLGCQAEKATQPEQHLNIP